ncbi:hypothetical protein ELH70_15335 [Rhizobium ruizarguesonis]|uniref:hypothetical protein n=1 Tax=Rhizobium ruizarguesonis TaxID=2081791 RepID=UPI0010325411|nr:hypothetical protein [Rhizobium ruizarguesonis]TAZ73925.1 hypothetical protein ELH70_15335 [Rhizobium ruizarguesonis]TBA00527.1 hypothetical protein ELH69_14515 [Rhizobium ruizarguesonis]
MKIEDQRVEDVLVHVRARYNSDLPHFTDCIRSAFSEVDAVFWRDQYLGFYWKCVTNVPGYIQDVVIANADAESHGSEGLHDLWQKVHGISEVEDGIRNHYLDESRHARLFLHLTDLSFPEYLREADETRLRNGLFDAPNASREKDDLEASIEYIIDNMIQMNIGEIRTRSHMFMIGPVLTAYAPREYKERVDGILGGLVYDEVTHIGYTANIMEEWCRNGHKKLIKDLYKRRLRDFNKFTIDQTRASVELYGQGAFPDIFEI